MAKLGDYINGGGTIFSALVDARAAFGARKLILEDQDRNPLSYTDLIRAAFALGRRIAALTEKGERVGVMLPASSAGVVTFFALHAFGRVPTMLNFTSGIRNLKAACELAGVKRVLTAHKFIEQGQLHDLVDALETVATVTYLEDVREKVGLADKLFAAAAGALPQRFASPTQPSDIGVILFTSGSFGAPKAVVLTQQNLIANVAQAADFIDIDPDWVLFNPLPIFHSFGLTGGILLPLLTGMKAFEYPSPLHVKQIPPLIKDTRAAILLATATLMAAPAGAQIAPGGGPVACGPGPAQALHRPQTAGSGAALSGDFPPLRQGGQLESAGAHRRGADPRLQAAGGLFAGWHHRKRHGPYPVRAHPQAHPLRLGAGPAGAARLSGRGLSHARQHSNFFQFHHL